MSECQLSAIGRDEANHSRWIERYTLFGLCGMARAAIPPRTHCQVAVCGHTVSSVLGDPHHYSKKKINLSKFCPAGCVSSHSCSARSEEH